MIGSRFRISFRVFLLATLTGFSGLDWLAQNALVAQGANASNRPPNVVLLLADDLGIGELGCYGQRWIKTPHVDRLAEEGTRFTEHYSGAPVCAPSRCVLLTGRHLGHSYVRNNREIKPEGQEPLEAGAITLAKVLQQNGYATGGMGKWGLGIPDGEGDPVRHGFDLFFGYHCQRHAHNHYPTFLRRNSERIEYAGNTNGLTGEVYSQDEFTREALEFIDRNHQRPFFLYMPFAIPHLSIQVPETSLDEYKNVIPEEDYVHRGYLQHPYPRAGYAAMISHMDRDIGKIMDKIRSYGLDDNTIVFFSSDNGPTYDRLGGSDSDFFQSSLGRRGLKGSVYEGGLRVPLIVRWKGKVNAAQVTDHPSAFWDWMPTILDLTGLQKKAPSGMDGLSFAPLLLGNKESQANPAYLYWEFPAYGGQQAIRWGSWKGVRQNLSQGLSEIELYDLATDPSESKDLARDNPDIVRTLDWLMQGARKPSAEFPFPALDRPRQ